MKVTDQQLAIGTAVFIVLAILWRFLDWPENYGKLVRGQVDNCVFVVGRYSYGGWNKCSAILLNGNRVQFSGASNYSAGTRVVFIELHRPISGMKSYKFHSVETYLEY